MEIVYLVEVIGYEKKNYGGTSKNSIKWILTVLNVLIPLFVVLIVLLQNGENVTNFFPRFNDEVCWWQQANAVASYGRPLGYWGYNGGTAPNWYLCHMGASRCAAIWLMGILVWMEAAQLYLCECCLYVPRNTCFYSDDKDRFKRAGGTFLCKLFSGSQKLLSFNCYGGSDQGFPGANCSWTHSLAV